MRFGQRQSAISARLSPVPSRQNGQFESAFIDLYPFGSPYRVTSRPGKFYCSGDRYDPFFVWSRTPSVVTRTAGNNGAVFDGSTDRSGENMVDGRWVHATEVSSAVATGPTFFFRYLPKIFASRLDHGLIISWR